MVAGTGSPSNIRELVRTLAAFVFGVVAPLLMVVSFVAFVMFVHSVAS